MKKYNLILAIFCCLSSYHLGAQNIQLTYNVYYNTSAFIEKTGYLVYYSNEGKSNYYEVFNKESESLPNSDSDTEMTIVVGDKYFISSNKINLKEKTLYSTEQSVVLNDTFLVKEDLPNIIWNINYDETFKIEGFNCKKATTYFRGRNYIAYYSTDLFVPVGPWKFINLPGIIIEVFDETRRYEWILSKVSGITLNEKELSKNKPSQVLSLKQYHHLIDNFFNQRSKQIEQNLMTRAERGTFIQDITVSPIRSGKELIYEWEEK